MVAPISRLHGTIYRGVPRICEGGGPRIFFFRLKNTFYILKRCNLVRFRVYFDQILSLFFSKNAIFYIKINILDTHLLWGISREEIFENLLRFMRFGVYFETKMAIFIKKIIMVYLHSYVLGARGHMLHEKILKIWCSFGMFWCIF